MRQESRGAPVASALRIGDLARLSGLGKTTIEHYLRLGLLQPAAVSDHGYRLFGDDTVDRLAVIRIGRRAGFTLAELRAALAVVDPSTLKDLLNAVSPMQCRAELVAKGVEIEL